MKPFVQRAQRQSRARTYVVCTSIQRKNSRFLCRIAKCRGKERERERETQSEFLFRSRRRCRDVGLCLRLSVPPLQKQCRHSLCKFSGRFSFSSEFTKYRVATSTDDPYLVSSCNCSFCLASIVTRAHTACLESWLPELRIGYACLAC